MKRQRLKHSYSADRPIDSKKKDILGRAKFAARLAEEISCWNGSDSLVIGLYGAWGTGKSSVKNMVLEALRTQKQPQLPIVDFNPWQLSGTGSIPAAFFRELGIALDSEDSGADAKERATKFKAYAKVLTLGGAATKIVGKTMAVVGVPGGPIMEYVGTGIETAGTTVQQGGDALNAKHDITEKSLEAQKRELANLLAKLPRPVLVVIDDIDRLSTDEILQVFQLVKANADFPRITYLLLFERAIVATALNKISGDKGTEFLKKIVQVGYHLPHAPQATVQKVLFDGLNIFLNKPGIAKHWENERWLNHYSDTIGTYFGNLRHVYRFLASFSFHVQQHLNRQSFEVNPLDLIVLETLRVFEPGVFEKLAGAKAVLTRHKSNPFGQPEQATIDRGMALILSAAASENREKVKVILSVLFPGHISQDNQDYIRRLRICHPDLFDKYFTLAIAEHDLSHAELEQVLAVCGEVTQFQAACSALMSRNLLGIGLERLSAHLQEIPLTKMGACIEALCNLSDAFPADEANLLPTDLESRAWWLVYSGLKREPDLEKRFRVLRTAIEQSTGLSLSLRLVHFEERLKARNEETHTFLVTEDRLPELKKVCLQKLRDASKQLWFREHSKFRSFLLTWSNWGDVAEVRSWLLDYTKTSEGAIWLLTVLLGETHSYGHDHRVRYYIKLSFIERFVDLQRFTPLIKQATSFKLTKKECRAIEEFNKALERRQEGKPEDDIEREWNNWENLE